MLVSTLVDWVKDITEVLTIVLSPTYKEFENLFLDIPPMIGYKATVKLKVMEPFDIVSRSLVPWVIAVQTLLAIAIRAKQENEQQWPHFK